MKRLSTLVAVTGLVATSVACGRSGEPPVLSPLEDQVVAVGSELVLQLIATDKDGDELFYSFSADVPEIQTRATITKSPNGAGIFRWTPLASDVGPWYFDFSVTDGSNTVTETIQIEVKSAVGDNSAPIFREPLGTGTTLDLSAGETCLDINIVVEDQDSAEVTISQEPPTIEHANLQRTGGLTARWSWCPSEPQIDGEDRYTLILGADDGTNPKTIKHYLVVLRKAPKPDCPGDPPVINHTPEDEDTILALTIPFTVSDDQGLKNDPLFYYATTNPGSPPNLGSMVMADDVVLITGNMQSGTWAADVPNPVVALPQGTSKTVYYVIVAQDNDDAEGDCDHITQAPSSGTYQMVVTNPGGSGGAGLCESCTADVQCGDSDDLCVRVGTAGLSYCLKNCSGPADCPVDYTCSATAVTSVDDASGRQCVPNSNDCTDPGGGDTCDDDIYEDNDSREEAQSNPVLQPGTYTDMTSCAAAVGDDEDWYRIETTGDSRIDLTLTGGSQSDLDLRLTDSAGGAIKSSMSGSSSESISECVVAGTYYIRVFAWSVGGEMPQNDYTLVYNRIAESCGSTACTDDDNEDDDNSTQARELQFSDIYPGPFQSLTQAICSWDDDWYTFSMVDGDTITVDLTFEQTTLDEDLDLHHLNGALVDLTPCVEVPFEGCGADQGQSSTSNEHYVYTLSDASCTIESQCVQYIFVHGWDGAENLYDISITLSF